MSATRWVFRWMVKTLPERVTLDPTTLQHGFGRYPPTVAMTGAGIGSGIAATAPTVSDVMAGSQCGGGGGGRRVGVGVGACFAGMINSST